MNAIRDRLDGWLGFLLVLAIGCAGVLVLAIVAPRELARTTWAQGDLTVMSDSPAGYVGLVSLCGLIAFFALLIAAWSLRTRLVAILLAAGSFASAIWVAVRYQRLLGQGVMGLEGRLDPEWSAGYTVEPPALLPFFVLVAIAGIVLTALYALVWWPRRREREHF